MLERLFERRKYNYCLIASTHAAPVTQVGPTNLRCSQTRRRGQPQLRALKSHWLRGHPAGQRRDLQLLLHRLHAISNAPVDTLQRGTTWGWCARHPCGTPVTLTTALACTQTAAVTTGLGPNKKAAHAVQQDHHRKRQAGVAASLMSPTGAVPELLHHREGRHDHLLVTIWPGGVPGNSAAARHDTSRQIPGAPAGRDAARAAAGDLITVVVKATELVRSRL